jgi:hypothetical protein
MAKNIKDALEDSALFNAPESVKKPAGRPTNPDIIRTPGTQEGLTADYSRATFILKVSTLANLKDYAYTERLSMKEAINGIIDKYIADYKKKNTLLHKR